MLPINDSRIQQLSDELDLKVVLQLIREQNLSIEFIGAEHPDNGAMSDYIVTEIIVYEREW